MRKDVILVVHEDRATKVSSDEKLRIEGMTSDGSGGASHTCSIAILALLIFTPSNMRRIVVVKIADHDNESRNGKKS